MYILVVGAGKVGYNLTKALMAEGQEVLVIEREQAKVDRILTLLGGTAIRGDGAEVATLELAGAGRADVVAAVTGDDEDNLVIAQVAKLKFGVPRTVARVNNPKNEFIFAKLGIDATVSATQIILSVIQQEIPEHPFVHLLSLQEGELELVELQLTNGASAAGKQLRDLSLPPETAIPLLVRDGKPLVVTPETCMQTGDKLIAVTTTRNESALREQVLGER